jgi:hypothetical protein
MVTMSAGFFFSQSTKLILGDNVDGHETWMLRILIHHLLL